MITAEEARNLTPVQRSFIKSLLNGEGRICVSVRELVGFQGMLNSNGFTIISVSPKEYYDSIADEYRPSEMWYVDYHWRE